MGVMGVCDSYCASWVGHMGIGMGKKDPWGCWECARDALQVRDGTWGGSGAGQERSM